MIDHADEGIYAEVFTTALESAAFAVTDYEELIQIGLSYIPADCGIAKAVRLAIECYHDHLTWKEARIRLLTQVPDICDPFFSEIIRGIEVTAANHGYLFEIEHLAVAAALHF